MISGFIHNYLKSPENIAIVIKNETYSYKELFEIACKIKTKLNNKDELIGIYTDYSIYTYASIIAVLLNGSGFVPINKKFPKDKLSNIINSSKIKTILCNNDSIIDLENNESKFNIDIISNDILSDVILEKLDATSHASSSNLFSTAYLLFTSGSTGMPKGIKITNKNFNSFIKSMTQSKKYDFNSSDVFLQIFELSFDVSIACTFIAWEVGACVAPVPTEGIVFIEALEIIKKHSVTVASIAPSALAYMKQLRLLEEFDFPKLRYTFFTGEALPYNLANSWKRVAPNSIIENAYGPTEVTVWSVMYRLNEESTPSEIINGLVPIGKVLDGLSYTICDENLNTIKAGQFGELLLNGSQVSDGYWQDDAKTITSFIDLNESKCTGKWYRTGDIVVENDIGNLVYINRMDNQVQINGFRVELGEIEFRIKEFTKKDSIVVLAFRNKNNTITLISFIENIEDNIQELKNHLLDTLPSYMIPKKFYSVKFMPLNNSGKIDKKKLLELHNE